MVVHGIPMAKLSLLLVKQMSKPFVNIFVSNAKNHPLFRKYICLPPAHLYTWFELRTKTAMLNFAGHKTVQFNVLTEEKSVELGASLICESLLYLIAAVLLIQEYNKSVKKEAVEVQKKKAEFTEIKDKVNVLLSTSEEQSKLLRDLIVRVTNLEGTPVAAPPSNPPIITAKEGLQIDDVIIATAEENVDV